MATDVDVQFFSHLNGLTLSNNWGDMIRLLDTCLVNGLPLTSITSATVDAQGDINLTLFAAHNCLLFQIVELSGFAPSGFNGKYRIKGTPSATTLILKAEKVGQTITTTGTAKLAPLGYEIKFRDLNDVKRAYRAIDPTDAHPFIRVDESLSGEGGGTYTSTYAKSAMVGLIENMTSIDDYLDPNKLQLPLDTSDFSKNWKVVGAGTSVVRGWSKWVWAYAGRTDNPGADSAHSEAPSNGNRGFTICGDKDAFYLLNNQRMNAAWKTLTGAGLYNACVDSDIVPRWFLQAALTTTPASGMFNLYTTIGVVGISPLMNNAVASSFHVTTYDNAVRIKNHATATAVLPNYLSGLTTNMNSNNVAALEIPFYDNDKYLRGNLKHVNYLGNTSLAFTSSQPMLADNSMYVLDRAFTGNAANNTAGGFCFYLGELE